MDFAPQLLEGAGRRGIGAPAQWQPRGSATTYGRSMKNARRDTVTPDSGDLGRGREAPMVITPRAVVRLAKQLAGGAHGSFVRRAAARRRGKRAES